MTGPYEPPSWAPNWESGEPQGEPQPPVYSGPPVYAGPPSYSGPPAYPEAPAYQPAYPGPPTYQPAYPGPPAYPGQWPGYPAAGPPWSAPRRGLPAWAWTLIAFGVIAAFALAVVAVNGEPTSPKDAAGTDGRSLRAPARFGDYATVRSIDPHQLADQMRGQLTSVGSADVIDRAQIGAYGRSAQLQIVFIGFELADVPAMKTQVAEHGVRSSVNSFSSGITGGVGGSGGSVTSNTRTVAAGPLGGFMRCGTVQLSGQPVGICAWGDRSAMAMTMVMNPADDAETARLTLQLRAAAEH